ncbi:hypothetical protein SLE2022_014190 [Rubroshorea leprosula]
MNIDPKTPVVDFLFLFLFVSSCCFLGRCCYAIDTIRSEQSIRDIRGETLISQDDIFELGFFSPPNSTLRFVGIWYHKIDGEQTVVWVANRDVPISDRNGVLRIGNDGNLEVLDGNNTIVWTSNASVPSSNTAAILLGTGNFVLSSNESIGDTTKAYWQSFDHPTDTYLPEMRVLVSIVKGENHALSSWKSASDPSPGNFSIGVDPFGAPQIVIWNQTRRMWRSGQWNGVVFTGVPNVSSFARFLYGFRLSEPEADGSMYFTYTPPNASDLVRFRMGWDGKEEQLRWDDGLKSWTVVQSEPVSDCDLYNFCGNFGVCDITKIPKCSCPQGFRPKFQDQWNRGNWSGGCERRTELQCKRNASDAGGNSEQDGFKGLRCMKLPDFANRVTPGNSETCRGKCLANCSCNAYADVTTIGCLIWTGDLIDVQNLDKAGNLMFLRLPRSELGSRKKISNLVIAIIGLAGVFFLCITIWLLWRCKRKMKSEICNSIPTFYGSNGNEFSADLSGSTELVVDGSQVNGPELPLFNFNFKCVAAATNNFSEENKLGQGGFGPVYKGELPTSQQIAVKRLEVAGRSGQGSEEFKNEIILIAKLQHRNLVRLLGCCIQGEEKLLIYEYMPNKSLDYFLFDQTKQALLDWGKRFAIIEGIARGLLYLHRDSRLRIIHRDLKSGNILLDEEMNPKISDFGMARIFGCNQYEANTVRVVGTYGYMSPEYAMEGLFSIKSDVYSFGVILLEIVSGRKNTSFHLSDCKHTSLIGYAWELWKENKPMELVDPSIRDTCNSSEALKCIHVGMLCVQDSAALRPKMESVVLILESEGTPTLPEPRQPNYICMKTLKGSDGTDFYLDGQDFVSSNDVTVTTVSGR